jgi:hypothetical protein
MYVLSRQLFIEEKGPDGYKLNLAPNPDGATDPDYMDEVVHGTKRYGLTTIEYLKEFLEHINDVLYSSRSYWKEDEDVPGDEDLILWWDLFSLTYKLFFKKLHCLNMINRLWARCQLDSDYLVHHSNMSTINSQFNRYGLFDKFQDAVRKRLQYDTHLRKIYRLGENSDKERYVDFRKTLDECFETNFSNGDRHFYDYYLCGAYRDSEKQRNELIAEINMARESFRFLFNFLTPCMNLDQMLFMNGEIHNIQSKLQHIGQLAYS